MITKDEIIPTLLKASPAFEKVFEEHQEMDLLYPVLGNFARHLLDLHNSDQIESLKSVANVIERLLLEGDDSVREATTVGLLEGIQNVWANNGIDAELFRPYLLPESSRRWDELNAFWQGKSRSAGEGFRESRRVK